ncbi:ATP-binding domain-containing protein [Vibrio brasiliensis]|uniref:ATP-binding domain-containing protein n=1 Tax=Vibrio brasiliensis TaxID=170652 RepID=UPI001EFE1A6B|nr:ATP-binding domain-containing protein [Vibrio brasiliensis]MCG9647966.1 ATP-binding domain-containing protein [Vibrio brasiliensis]
MVENKLEFQLSASQQHVLSMASQWIAAEDSSVLAITGAACSGKKTVLRHITQLLAEYGKSPVFLCPNARIANKYKAHGFPDVQSIYSWLYASRPSTLEKNKACYDVSVIYPDVDREVLVFLDAHLLGDDKFETETTRYGTGFLFQDLISALMANDPVFPKMLLFGDPFQLTRGRIQRSFLAGDVFREKNISFSCYSLSEQISTGDLIQFQRPLISALSSKTFTRLPAVAGENIAEVIPGEHTDQIGHALLGWPKHTAFLCAQNIDAFKINRGVRAKYLSARDMHSLVEGDIVDLHNRTAGLQDEPTDTIWVNAGTFGRVVSVDPNIETITRLLKGRETGTVLHFSTAVIRFEGMGDVKVRYIPEYLSAETPELTVDQLIVLNVIAREEATEKLQDKREQLERSKERMSEAEYKQQYDSYQKDLSSLIMSSSYFNAARLRFAYAMTVHRSQGHSGWQQLYVDASCSHDNANYSTDSYFRWLYTATCCTKQKVALLNYPNLSPISNASWNFIPKKVSPIIVKHRFYLEPRNLVDELNRLPGGFDTSNSMYAKLYFTLKRLLCGSDWKIEDVIQGRPYQQVYELVGPKGELATVQFSYNGKGEITIQSVNVSTDAVRQRILSLLFTKPHYQYSSMEEAIHELTDYLSQIGWQQALVEEKSQYKAYVTFIGNNGHIKFDLNVDGKGLISSIKIEQADSEDVCKQFIEALKYVG